LDVLYHHEQNVWYTYQRLIPQRYTRQSAIYREEFIAAHQPDLVSVYPTTSLLSQWFLFCSQ
jgi:hypothetical protein